MTGYVGEERAIGPNPTEIRFLLDARTGLEKRFGDRQDAIIYLKTIMHYHEDDMRFFFWFEDGEDIRRYLLTGELVMGIELNDEDVLIARNFYTCVKCGNVFRRAKHPECPVCGTSEKDSKDVEVCDILEKKPWILTPGELDQMKLALMSKSS